MPKIRAPEQKVSRLAAAALNLALNKFARSPT